MAMSFCFSITYVASIHNPNLPPCKVVLCKLASCIAVQLKQTTLGGSLTFQISFQSQLSVIAFRLKVGNGQDSSLWGDNWLGNGLLRNLYPDVYILNLQQRASINEGFKSFDIERISDTAGDGTNGRKGAEGSSQEPPLARGWDIFADKIGSFLARHRVEENRMKQRLVDSNVSFVEAVRIFKWSNSKGDGVNTIFKSIGDFCGGWVETEEETQLRNHLKWARIRVEGDGSRIPKEVTILNAGISFSMQLWTELPMRYVVGKESESPPIIHQFARNYPVANRRTDGAASFKTRGVTVKDKGPGPTSNSNLMAILGRFSPLLNQGPKHNQHHKQPDPTDNTKNPKILNDFSHERGTKGEKDLREIKDLAIKFLQAFKNWEKEAEVEEDMMGQKEGDAKNVSNQETTRNRECSKKGKESKIRTNIMQEAEQNLQIQQIHEADPVNIQFPSSQEIRPSQYSIPKFSRN
ncbi:hypothetical protein MTR67_007406 [Solanum verrucosum]|uniref:DUF4283 domain-containing protein n=1 Tax=Solanum verrucosum TaxID=315347 RepID=A0AAF0Q532_SOLVR|nr:hypothetical protein MTR67_007406 [Solanum verrucosum]